MTLDREDRMLVEALRVYAKGNAQPAFPFDDLKFTLEAAANRLAQLAGHLSGDTARDEIHEFHKSGFGGASNVS